MNGSSLEQWHEAFSKKKDAELTVGDVAVAIRQNIDLDRVLPIAKALFREDPTAGEQYDGELFFALTGVDLATWEEDLETFTALRSFAKELFESEDINGKIHIKSWFEKIGKLERQKI